MSARVRLHARAERFATPFAFALWSSFTATHAVAQVQTSAQAPIGVIVETDMGGDTDDAAMLGFLHRLADEGEIEILAVMHNGNNPWGAAAVSAINTYYSRPSIPIGTYRTAAEAQRPEYHPLVDPAVPDGPRRSFDYVAPTPEGRWVRLLAENFPCRYATRLDFPDAVDVYRRVLETSPHDELVIVNGGFLGNLVNLVASFDADPGLGAMFVARVDRMTGAVGGVNTCDQPFPPGMAEFVFDHRRHRMPTLTALGGPIGTDVMVQTTAEMGTAMPIDSPVREAYRYKTEVEHQNRNTVNAWSWHIIDVLTSFSTIAWDRAEGDGGSPYFDVRPSGSLEVFDNCTAVQHIGVPPAAGAAEFCEVGMHVPPSSDLVQMSNRLARRYFEDGIYPAPARPWAAEREHRAVSAMFEDGTFGGLDLVFGDAGTRVEDGRLCVPATPDPATTGATLMFEGRRYTDQTFVLDVDEVPALDAFAPTETSAAYIDYWFWCDGRNDARPGVSPRVRVVAWPGRGFQGAPGRPVYVVRVFEPVGDGVTARLLGESEIPGLAAGDPFAFRVAVSGNTVQVTVTNQDLFATPLALSVAPPADGGLSAVSSYAVVPVRSDFRYDLALLRPDADGLAHVDVSIDKEGTVWFCYLKHGDLYNQLRTTPAEEHFVDLELVSRNGEHAIYPVRVPWDDQNPGTFDWADVVGGVEWEAFAWDHWVYGIRSAWRTGDGITLQFGSAREGARMPITVLEHLGL